MFHTSRKALRAGLAAALILAVSAGPAAFAQQLTGLRDMEVHSVAPGPPTWPVAPGRCAP